MDTPVVRFIDLFCGLGAFHTAFRSFQCVFACDIDEGARSIYKENYGHMPHDDIRTIDIGTLPDFDLLCAGFPCQPFSIAGKGEGFHDKEKGNLFYDILTIVDAKRPPMCILENVKNLKTHDKGNTYTTILREFHTRGYQVTSSVLNAVEYGSPQARQRIFLVATLGRPFSIPVGNGPVRPVSTILDPTLLLRDDLDRTHYTLKEKKKNDSPTKKPHILYDVYPIPSEKKKKAIEETNRLLQQTGLQPVSVEKGGRQGERVYSVDAVGVTVCASSGGPGAKTGLYKVGEAIRRLSVKETLGMFGFPLEYKFPNMSDEDALFYLGNSIVVDVLKAFVPGIREWFSSHP